MLRLCLEATLLDHSVVLKDLTSSDMTSWREGVVEVDGEYNRVESCESG